MKFVLLLGARSDIGQALANKYAEQGYSIYLAARNVATESSFAKHLNIKYQCETQLCEFDAEKMTEHEAFYAALDPKPVGVICVVGYLGEQLRGQNELEELVKITQTNYTGCASILSVAANQLEKEGRGFIIGVSSVAGDRGRQSNYLYGSAKAALTCFLSGLRNRLFNKGIHVLTVKPGFVYTKMTQSLALPARLTGNANELARSVFVAQQKGKSTLYYKGIWRLIMLIIKTIPESIFKRTNL